MILKELFDRILATIGLIVASPFMFLIGISIKAESPGPIFFKHLRVGRNGKTFWMYKFRKMPHKIINGPQVSPKYDHRLTKVGRVIERLKLDELPQLINIIKGDMSFVGPRPEVPEIVELYTNEQRIVLSVKPGLVGPNQIAWRNEKDLIPEGVDDIEAYYIEHILPLKLERDSKYVEDVGFLSDLKYFFHALMVTIFEPLNIKHLLYRRRQIYKVITDIILCIIAFGSALLIKYDFQPNVLSPKSFGTILSVLCIAQGICFIFFGIYQRIWYYFGKLDLIVLIKAIVVGNLISLAVLSLIFKFQYPLSLLILHTILNTCILTGFRIFVNYIQYDFIGSKKINFDKNILIYGAQEEGELFIRRVLANLGPKVKPIGFLDNDPLKRGNKIHGVKVMGDASDLPLLKNLHNIESVYIAVNNTMNGDLENLLTQCKNLQVNYNFVSTTYSSKPNVKPYLIGEEHNELV